MTVSLWFQTEAPLLIRPYLADMTLSEIHTVMTGGFATIAGTVLGAFISFGVRHNTLNHSWCTPVEPAGHANPPLGLTD